MINRGYPRKIQNYWHNFLHNELTVAIIIIAFSYTSQYSNSLEYENLKIDCSQSTTCTTCTSNTKCNWSLDQQLCTHESLGNLTVYKKIDCPKLSVVQKFGVEGSSFKYKINITNYKQGFKTFLYTNKNKILCCLEKCFFYGTLMNNEISCPSIRRPSKTLKPSNALLLYFYIKINNVPLMFDNEDDYYFTYYDHDCGNKVDDSCVSCLWNANGYKYYLKWCSSDNQCTGLYRFFDKRDRNDFSKAYTLTEDNLHINCPDIKIQSFEPLSAPWTGGTSMNITVKNHRISIENKTMVVTVAGRNCADPKTIDSETITCVISPANGGTRLAEGPVEVVYVSSTKFTLRSSETFEFVDAEVTDVSPACGPTKGGTVLNVSGTFLDAGNSVRVSVGENITCRTIERGPNSITCLTGPSGAPVTDRVKVEFDGTLSKYVQSPEFVYAADPTLEAAQSFGGVVSGGTAVPVRGRRFSCVKNPKLYVYHNGVRRFTECRLKNESFMVCASPEFDASVAAETPMALDYGFQMDFADSVFNLFPEPDSPSFLVYPDPVFTDFEINNRSVTINGNSLDRGYQIDDIVVRLQNHTGDCVVTSITRRRIVCESTSTGVLDDVHAIVVYVGDNLEYNVKKKSIPDDGPIRLSSFYYGSVAVVLFVKIVIVGFMIRRRKSKQRNDRKTDKSLTELQSLQSIDGAVLANLQPGSGSSIL